MVHRMGKIMPEKCLLLPRQLLEAIWKYLLSGGLFI